MGLPLVLILLISATARIESPEAPGPGAASAAAFDGLDPEEALHAATAEFARLRIPDDLALEESALEESEDHDEMLPSPVASPGLMPVSLSDSTGPRASNPQLAPPHLQRLRC